MKQSLLEILQMSINENNLKLQICDLVGTIAGFIMEDDDNKTSQTWDELIN